MRMRFGACAACMRLLAMEGVSGRRSALSFHEEARGNGLAASGERVDRRPIAARTGGGDRDIKGAFAPSVWNGRTIPTRLDRVTQRFARRETRDPPALLPSTGPEPFGERSFVFGRERVPRLNAAGGEHEAQASVRERPPVQIGTFLRREHTRHRDARSELVRSADVGRNASPGRDAREREQRSRKRAT